MPAQATTPTLPANPLTGPALALFAALGFSTIGVLGKLSALHGLPALSALPWRFGIASALLLPFARGLGWRVRGRMLAVGLLYCLATHAYFLALGRITAGATSLLLYVAPAFVLLYGALLPRLGRRPGRGQLGATLLTLLGLGLVVGLPGNADRDPLGLACGVLAAALYGAYLLASEGLGGESALASSGHMALCAALYFTLLDASSGGLVIPRGAAQWGVVLALVVGPTLLAVPALYAATSRIGAGRASLIATTEPLWTVLLALLFLGEPLRAGVVLGGGLLAQRGERAVPLTPPLEL